MSHSHEYIIVDCVSILESHLWVSISSTGKVSDSCIRDMGFDLRLH